MISRTKTGRPSRKRVHVDWSGILDRIKREEGKIVEVPKPPHLSILQTRNKILDLAKERGMCIDYRIIMGHLDVWMD